MISQATYEIVDNIINKFDFELVQAYMIVNKWTWKNEKKIPSIDYLKYVANSLLTEVISTSEKNESDEYTFSSTDGFKASYYKRCNKFALEFIIERKYTGAIKK